MGIVLQASFDNWLNDSKAAFLTPEMRYLSSIVDTSWNLGGDQMVANREGDFFIKTSRPRSSF